jgi:RNA polymerase sigma-70 factor (ECF subfamily)
MAWRFLPRAKEDAPSSDGRAIESEVSACVRQAVADLPQRLREVIVLHYLQEMAVEEICGVVGTSRGAVEVRLHRGRERLRGVLSDLIKE